MKLFIAWAATAIAGGFCTVQAMRTAHLPLTAWRFPHNSWATAGWAFLAIFAVLTYLLGRAAARNYTSK